MLALAESAFANSSARFDFWFTRAMYGSGDWNVDQRMPSNLLTALVDYTHLKVDPVEHILALDDPRLAGAPFVWLAGHRLVQFSDSERAGFEAYLRGGGFMVVDDCNHDIDGLFAKSFEEEIEAIFGANAMPRLPADHPLYDSYFNFDGPPPTSLELNGWGDDLVHDYLRGITLDGRLALVYSNKDYGCEWDYHWRNKRFLAEDNTRFSVNLVMQALNG